MAQAKAGSGQTPYLQTPPELPAIPGMDTQLAGYLRRFGLWCQGNFNSALQKRSATGELFLRSATGNTAWVLTIDDSGALHTAQMTPGKGHP